MTRKKENKIKKKKEAIVDKTDQLKINPLSGKPIDSQKKSGGFPEPNSAT